MDEHRRWLRREKVGRERTADALAVDCLQYMHESRARIGAGLAGGAHQALHRHTDGAGTPAEQAQARVQLPSRYQGVLSRGAVHQFRGHRLERLDPLSERISRLLLQGILQHGLFPLHQRLSIQRRHTSRRAGCVVDGEEERARLVRNRNGNDDDPSPGNNSDEQSSRRRRRDISQPRANVQADPFTWAFESTENKLIFPCLQRLLSKVKTFHRRNEIVPCCSPTQLSPLQLLYVESNNSIAHKTLPNMVVEACGCM
uniref:TGF-beta family profile domain-containing protein n=1 Tax=Trichogramma kaykai TaxID=54128 RepID=A0ABD2W920_9HYME